MNNQNAFIRLGNLITLLRLTYDDQPLSGPASLLNVPEDVLANDLFEIIKSGYLDFEDEDLSNILDQELNDVWLRNQISRNAYDYVLADDTEFADLYLDSEEQSLLKMFYPAVSGIPAPDIWRVKNTLYANTETDPVVASLRSRLFRAILDKCPVSFDVKNNRTEEVTHVELSPHYLHHDLDNNRQYLVSFDESGATRAFRLDYIDAESLKFLKSKDYMSLDDYPECKVKMSRFWGGFLYDADPVRVKVRFDFESANTNLRNKVEAVYQRRCRTNPDCRLYQNPEDQYWYYEDYLIGEDAFASWIRQFGISAVVLEPISLARKMYDSARARLARYDDYIASRKNDD